MRWIASSCLPIVCFIVTFFSQAPAEGAAKLQARPPEDNLTHDFARMRKSQVRSVDYELRFTLNKGAETFSASTIMSVELARTDAPLSIDLLAKSISSVRVNGVAVTDFGSRKGSFDIPAKRLAKKMRIEIDYTGSYNKEGQGIQSVVDPEDGSEYVFTDFEPYYAHNLFPCFDQPDLKATFAVTVDAPTEWKVIGNELVKQSTPAEGRTKTVFVTTPRLSTYLFFLGAGPFVEWNDKLDDLPLVIHARKSLAKYVDAPKIFETSKKGLRFFGEYFDTPYPFSKFGMVFIPEFAWGGMENPGAITMNERNIFRGPVPISRYEGRDELILHEMAHMWFGDLVTMAWWDDLWLNESFASYVSQMAQDRALKSESAWKRFFSTKTWGYWQDQLVTTHPIETKVLDVRTGKGNFDGITYAKGASALKQLHFFVGEDGFRNGIRSYFKKYSYKNTTRADFVGEIAKASKTDLAAWTKSWLQTAGPNRVLTDWTCADGRIKTFKVVQRPSISKTLSPHRTRLGLFRATDGGLEPIKTHEVAYAKAETPVATLIGTDCPDFVYPNVDDQDYALFALDANSLKVANSALTGGLESGLLRLMIWSTLAQMVRDTQLPIQEYFSLALAGLDHEADDGLLGILLGRYSTIREYYFHYLNNEKRAELAPRLESVVWKRLAKEPAGDSKQMVFFDFYVSIAQTKEALDRLSGFLKGEAIPHGIAIDQDRRWEIVEQLAAAGYAGATALVDNEEKRDPSTAGKRYAYGARAAIPSPDVKKKVWADFQKSGEIPFSYLREAAGNFNSPNHSEYSRPFVEPFFKTVTTIDWKSNDNLVEIYLEKLFPHNLCSSDLLRESESQLKKAKNLIPLARRTWLEANDELAKCIAVRRVSGI